MPQCAKPTIPPPLVSPVAPAPVSPVEPAPVSPVEPAPVSWFERRTSPAHGDGVFALVPIAAGTPLFQMATKPFLVRDELTDEMRVMQIDTNLYSADSGGVEDFLNHSCEPNLGYRDGSAWLATLRNIDLGEELFWDYSTSENDPGWSIPCRCEAASCRGAIASFCELTRPQQELLVGRSLRHVRDWFVKLLTCQTGTSVPLTDLCA